MIKPWRLVALIVIGIVMVAGIVFLATQPPRGDAIVLLPAPTPAPIMVHISGFVIKPGVYHLPSDSRLNDAIQAAGGFAGEADVNALNLARPLEDGEQIVVPGLLAAQENESGSSRNKSPEALLNINTATLEELDTLPGIGPEKAQWILDYRSKIGSFSTTEELLDVPGIGQVIYDEIRELITVGQ